MTHRKERLTVTVDPELIDAGNKAVAAGRADSLSGWVNAALADRTARDRRLEALTAAIADYEAEFGEITHEEIASLQRSDRESAVVARGRRPRSTRKPGQPGRGAA
jgi:glycerol dehydrogenase-like iron-containing ADH family enzyme